MNAGRESDGTPAPTGGAVLPVSPTQGVAPYARRLAHDLNNFATVVRTYSELLMADLPDGSTRSDAAEIYRSADAMIAYLHRVTRFTRAAVGRPVPISLIAVARDVVEEFAEARDLAPVHLIGDSAVPVVADPEWLREALRELILNAREAAPPASRIDVVVSEQRERDGERRGVIEVCDAGDGFADSLEGAPEEPFVTTKVGVRGAGFGLTIATAVAEACGAHVRRAREDGVTRVSLWLRVHE